MNLFALRQVTVLEKLLWIVFILLQVLFFHSFLFKFAYFVCVGNYKQILIDEMMVDCSQL